jgi:hypothetical protein
LVEILVAIILVAILLLGVWSLADIYLSLFEKGQAKADEAQLGRALMAQFSADLRSAIQDTAPRSRGRTSAVRRFALVGSTNALRLDVLQLTPENVAAVWEEASDESSDQERMDRVPELRTVEYVFIDPETWDETDARDDEAGAMVRPGLIRREYDFGPEDEPGERSGAAGRSDLSAEEREFAATDPSAALTAEELFAVDADDNSIMWAPEVVRLEFRYFDGGGWRGDWNSLDRKSLPVAVEIVMQIDPDGRRVRRLLRGEEEPQSLAEEDETSDVEEHWEDDSVAGKPGLRAYRLVIDLPGAKLHRSSSPAPTGLVSAPVARPSPSPPPPAVRPSRPAPPTRSLSDEWMRRALK